eukprot:147570_1
MHLFLLLLVFSILHNAAGNETYNSLRRLLTTPTPTYVELTPLNPIVNGASVILDPSNINTDAIINNNEWQITSTSSVGWQMLISLNNTWGFSKNMISTITLTIFGTSAVNAGDSDLRVAFSVNSSQYISTVYNMDNQYKSLLLGNNTHATICDNSTTPTQNILVGDIENFGKINNRGYASPFTNILPQYSPGTGDNNNWPMIFKIVNNPLSDFMFFSVTNPQREDIQQCGFGESFISNNGIQIFIGGDGNGEYLSFEKFRIELEGPTAAPTVNPTIEPTTAPSNTPSYSPSNNPSQPPSFAPSLTPTNLPSLAPTQSPSIVPSLAPTQLPSIVPSKAPSISPTQPPSIAPSLLPSILP